MTKTEQPKTRQPIVYVREAAEDQIPEKLRGSEAKVYAVHDMDGKCLAIATDRKVAFALALKNDLRPVSVH